MTWNTFERESKYSLTLKILIYWWNFVGGV